MSEAPKIYAALAAVMADVGAVGKSRKNASQGYQFRGVEDVVAHVQDVMAKHGVVCVPRVLEREREMLDAKSGGKMFSVRLLVEHTFFASDGSSVTCTTLGEAMDSGDKASNKAMSAALKYCLTESLLIPTYEVDRDTEEHSPQIVSKSPPKPAPVRAPATQAMADMMAKQSAYPAPGLAPASFVGQSSTERAAEAAMDAYRAAKAQEAAQQPKPTPPPAGDEVAVAKAEIAAAPNMAALAAVGNKLIKTPHWKAAGIKEAFTRRQQQLVSGEKAEAARGAA